MSGPAASSHQVELTHRESGNRDSTISFVVSYLTGLACSYIPLGQFDQDKCPVLLPPRRMGEGNYSLEHPTFFAKSLAFSRLIGKQTVKIQVLQARPYQLETPDLPPPRLPFNILRRFLYAKNSFKCLIS